MNRAFFHRQRTLGVLVQLQEQAALLRAGHQQRFAGLGGTLKLRRFATAQGREMGLNLAQAGRIQRRTRRRVLSQAQRRMGGRVRRWRQRVHQCRCVQRHRPVAVAN